MQKSDFRNIVLSGLVFGPIMGLLIGLQTLLMKRASISDAIFFGLLAMVSMGFGFALVMGLFLAFQYKKFAKMRESIEKEEAVLYWHGANHFVGAEAVGGALFLTPRYLTFISHKVNIQNHELNIRLTNVLEVSVTRVMIRSKGGILVTTRDYRTEKFVVNDAAGWVSEIEAAIHSK